MINLDSEQKRNIIISCDTLITGGAETFAMRMARFYTERGHKVYLFSFLSDKIDYDLVKSNAGSEVEIITLILPKFFNWILYKIDGLLFRFKHYLTIRRYLTISFAKKIIKEKKIDVVQTNMLGSLDAWSHAIKDNSRVKLIHTIHGDIISLAYAQVSRQEQKLNTYDFFYLSKLVPQILKRIDFFVCPAEMHIKILKSWGRIPLEKVKKIYYPLEVKPIHDTVVSRENLGIPQDSFVYGSVARCIIQKGWNELIQSFMKLNSPNTYLILVGDGQYLSSLKKQYGNVATIKFVGKRSYPSDYIRLFDVGVSSSYYWESLPTAIIEYLSLGKPVICTDNAESKNIIKSNQGPAGLVFPLKKNQWEVIEEISPMDLGDLEDSLLKIYSDKELFSALSKNSLMAFKKFDPFKIIKEYESLFVNDQPKF